MNSNQHEVYVELVAQWTARAIEAEERAEKAERERDELASYYCVKDINQLRAKHWREAALRANSFLTVGDVIDDLNQTANAIERGE